MTTEFVTIELDNKPTTTAQLSGYREVIESYADKGFAFSGYVPVKFGPSGKMLIIDLVFQKKD